MFTPPPHLLFQKCTRLPLLSRLRCDNRAGLRSTGLSAVHLCSSEYAGLRTADFRSLPDGGMSASLLLSCYR